MHTSRWDVRGLADFDFLSSEYADLFARADATVFQSPFWLDRLYHGLAAGLHVVPLVVTIHDQASGQLAAVIPLVRRRYRGLAVAEFADLGVSDYCAIVADAALLPELLSDASLPARVQRALGACDLVMVTKVPMRALPAFDLLGHARKARMPFNAQATVLTGPFDEWRERTISATQRRFLNTKRKRVQNKFKIETRIADQPRDIETAIDHIRAFRDHRFRTAGLADLLREEAFVAFYRDIAQKIPPARAYVMTLDGTAASAAFGLVHNGAFHLLLSGFDFLNHRNASLGLLIIEDIIRDCIARGETTFDFTIGNQPYKREFGTVETRIWSVWAGVSLKGRIVAFALSRSLVLRNLARWLGRRGTGS
jgi:CelD/BcsL family acetyltransferase involved in cellulose biosynthesis